MIDLNEVVKDCYEISKKREANGSVSTTSILKHLSTEVVELAEANADFMHLRQYVSESELQRLKEELGEEIADVIICCFIEAGIKGIDMEKALLAKIEKNRARAERRGDKL